MEVKIVFCAENVLKKKIKSERKDNLYSSESSLANVLAVQSIVHKILMNYCHLKVFYHLKIIQVIYVC